MKEKLWKAAKFLVPMISFGASIATSIIKDKELDETVTQKVTEAISKMSGKES